jgi:hypothetical protein
MSNCISFETVYLFVAQLLAVCALGRGWVLGVSFSGYYTTFTLWLEGYETSGKEELARDSSQLGWGS